jgi:hypothetical protein
MANGIQREPCFWLTTGEDANRERTRTRMVAGRKVTERLPQHGHEGDYENKRKARGRRFIMIVRHEGHVVPLLLTNAAAHLTPGPYSQYQLNKGKHFGWYPEGACPCALYVAGELTDDHVVSSDVKSGSPCEQGSHSAQKPCKHDLAERAARTKQWNDDQNEKMSAFQDKEEKLAATQRQINKELVLEVANVVAEKVAGSKRKAGE